MAGFFYSLVNLDKAATYYTYVMPKKAGKMKLPSLPFPCPEASSDIGTLPGCFYAVNITYSVYIAFY